MLENSTNKKLRQDKILDYITKHPNCTQIEIQLYLKNKKIRCSQATISRDIDDLDYEVTENGYQKKEDILSKEKRELVEKLIKHHAPSIRIQSDLTLMTIKTKVGSEYSISSALYDLYGHAFTGIFPGIGCILIIFRNAKNAKKISKVLKSYVHGESKYAPIQDNDEPNKNDTIENSKTIN